MDLSPQEKFEIFVSLEDGFLDACVDDTPVLTASVSNVEESITEALTENISGALRSIRSQVVVQDLIVPIYLIGEVPDNLDLSSIINEESDDECQMEASLTVESKEESCCLVGGSKFYDMTIPEAVMAEESTSSPTEKQDHMKPTESEEEVSDVDQECTVFSGVSYLGAQNITDPKSESDIQRIMQELSAMPESKDGIAVSVSIPVCSQGVVVMYQADSNSVMMRYAVNRISFYARGTEASPVAACFAFTWSHGRTRETAVCRCHVFRCSIAEAVTQVSACFAKAFERIPRSMASSIIGELSAAPSMSGSMMEGDSVAVPAMQLMHVLECTVNIKEADAKGSYTRVPKERLGFKLRGGVDKLVSINVQQMSNNSQVDNESDATFYTGGMIIERCFGILVGAGRNVKQTDMRLLELLSGSSEGSQCSMSALWNSGEPALAPFNLMSGDGTPNFMSLAFDLVIRGIPDPLRLVIETPVKVIAPSDRSWYPISKRPLIQQFFIYLKESIDASGQLQYEVVNVEPSGEIDRSRLNLPSLSSLLPSPLTSAPAPPSPTEVESDGDEPLLSGTGQVSKDCGVDVLDSWNNVLRSWTGPRPRALNSLVRMGVPEALRCEVWLRLADVDQDDKLMETYRTLISKECSFESVIQRDIARTFPAHDFFKEAGGLGQDSLLRIARVYAVYDQEVGYCQGLSFLAATLVLHMPEEQAFCLLVRLMYGYGLRELYKDGFEALYMRLHQLDRLMEEQLGDLRAHFQNLGVEPHMYASQWFLTVFTARFPLPLVYHILDVFLLQGVDTLFQVALALLSRSRKDLLQHDFEGVLKYFRVTLPKKFRAEESSRQIVKLACSIKVKRLHKYQLEYEKFIKESAEKEKINVELERLKVVNSQLQSDAKLLETQLSEAMQLYRDALKESTHHTSVASDYRDICARMDRQLHHIQDVTKDCVSCSKQLTEKDNKVSESEEKVVKSDDTEEKLKERVRELELELAQVKLAHVQAQCNNQELTHQLNSALNEIRSAMNQKQSVTPWLVRTLGSIMDAAQNKPSFQSYVPNAAQDTPQPVRRQHSSNNPAHLDRRVSEPPSPDIRRKREINTKRHSLLLEANKNTESQQDANRQSHNVPSV